jgi:hypothetical protein
MVIIIVVNKVQFVLKEKELKSYLYPHH